ncbi:IS91 family transposase [Epilithonimonas vandammei]|uniref:IS91 family transposase n=1 Tax=Epilithonimonas vandammei TaxID=2487072 RepID=A0A3G8ZAW4_9FLAO|nr:IS91 family transposase [Epilithonimonas vandammei]AZI53757.1 IS91 family transposase [Epilithonimonas vandammei]AZI55537.1 IS91 family transposase [Epilithonimonas vandammei]
MSGLKTSKKQSVQPQSQPQYEVADVLNILGSKLENLELNSWQLRTLFALKKCRTSALGGHIDACDECGNVSISYNSCRNRHCPKCQGKNREDWIQTRENELLPVPYFHVVFTLPEVLNKTALHEPKMLYDILFESAWETLQTFGKNKNLQMGMIAVLHTWGQNLSLHPHLHCIVPGGGVDESGTWKNIRSDGKFLFSVKALSKVFRAKFCEKLKANLKDKFNENQENEYEKIRQSLWEKPWVVYAKKPFGSPKSVVEYLGRYSHKIAVSNQRIRKIDSETVTFSYKDYRQKGIKKQMVLSHEEFIRRFAMHILPKRFVKIRHYGFLSSTWKRIKLKKLQQKLGIQPKEKLPPKVFQPKCSCCKTGNLVTIAMFDLRGPPQWFLEMSQSQPTPKK